MHACSDKGKMKVNQVIPSYQFIPHSLTYNFALSSEPHLSHVHFTSPLGARVRRFGLSCGAVPPKAGEPAGRVSADRDCSRMLLSLRLDVASSLLEVDPSRADGAAIEDREFRSIEVRGKRLLFGVLESSELVLRTPICGRALSRLFGR